MVLFLVVQMSNPQPVYHGLGMQNAVESLLHTIIHISGSRLQGQLKTNNTHLSTILQSLPAILALEFSDS